MENVMHLHKAHHPKIINREQRLSEITFPGPLLSKNTFQPKKDNKSDKIVFKIMKQKKSSTKKTKTTPILFQLSLPSIKNGHTISIEEKALKHSFSCSFLHDGTYNQSLNWKN